jgi:hypothetical protein
LFECLLYSFSVSDKSLGVSLLLVVLVLVSAFQALPKRKKTVGPQKGAIQAQ